jgi:hypothetical protein
LGQTRRLFRATFRAGAAAAKEAALCNTPRRLTRFEASNAQRSAPSCTGAVTATKYVPPPLTRRLSQKAEAAELLHHDGRELTERLIEKGEWMPLAFVDECERAGQGGDAALTATLRQVQAAEFDSLLEYILAGG